MGRRKLIEDDELLARVRAVLIKEGITVSSRQIAEAVGVSSAVLFQRYGSKENLLFAAMTPPAPDMKALLRRSGAREHGLAQLQQIAVGLLDYFRQFVAVLAPLANHPSFSYESFRQRQPGSPLEQIIAELTETFEAQRQLGEIDCPDVGVLVLNLIAVAHSLAMFERMGAHHGEFSKPLVADLARLLWSGIAPADQREPPNLRKKSSRKRGSD
ncbi:MAG: TetR/AcrR family transcriptional regulator [Polyangia bacterium]